MQEYIQRYTQNIYTTKDQQKTIYEVDEFINNAESAMARQIDKEELSDNQKQMVADLCESIVCSENKESWAETMESCVKDFKEIETLQTLTEVLSISSEHKLELYPAAILYHSNNEDK